jgi:hypothetical protein
MSLISFISCRTYHYFFFREVLNITAGDFMQELQENTTCYFKKKKKTYNSLFYWKSWVDWVEISLSILLSCVSSL